MTSTLRRQGLDAREVWVETKADIALGPRYLSILDLSPDGAQLMHSTDGCYVIAFNGESYNWDTCESPARHLFSTTPASEDKRLCVEL